MVWDTPQWMHPWVRALIQFVFTGWWLYLVFFSNASGLLHEVMKLLVFMAWGINLGGWVSDIRFGKAGRGH